MAQRLTWQHSLDVQLDNVTLLYVVMETFYFLYSYNFLSYGAFGYENGYLFISPI